MPTVNELVSYVKKYELSKHYKSPRALEDSYVFSSFLTDCNTAEDNDEVFSCAFTLYEFTSGKYGNYYMTSAFFDKKPDNKLLCSYLINASAMLLCNYLNTLKDQKRHWQLFSEQGAMLLSIMACNDFELINSCYPLIIDSIKNGKMSKSTPWGGDGDGNVYPPDPQKLGVLFVEMMASEKTHTINWDSFNIPVDPFYIRFCQEGLYATDEVIVKQWLTELCDKHLTWSSRFMVNAERSRITGYEIQEPVLLLWPFEYQAVKNFRARHGLTTPEIDHPLLKTPMAGEHIPDFSQWKAPEWFYPLLDRLIAINPQMALIKKLLS